MAAPWASEDITMGDVLRLWIEDRAHEVRPQTMRSYLGLARWLEMMIGAVPVIDAQPPSRIRQILAEVEAGRGAGAMQKARAAIGGALGVAVEQGIIDHNPVREIRRRKRRPSMPRTLNPHQVATLRALLEEREDRVSRYVGASAYVLGWVIEIMLGSGLRINEVLALRHMDVDWKANSVTVTGTLVDDPKLGLVRQGELKAREQARTIYLPEFAMHALERARESRTRRVKESQLSPAVQGRVPDAWCYARNVRRSLRHLRESPALVDALSATGLVSSDLTPHIFRRTAATLVALSTGDLRDAQLLLGHSDKRTTMRSYAGVAFTTVTSATALDASIGRALSAGEIR